MSAVSIVETCLRAASSVVGHIGVMCNVRAIASWATITTRWLGKGRITYIYSKTPTTQPANVRYNVFNVFLAVCLFGYVQLLRFDMYNCPQEVQGKTLFSKYVGDEAEI